MNGRKPPSKPVLVAAILPLFIAVAGMIVFSHFGLPTGAIICIVALVAYYVVFGIVFAVVTLKQDKKEADEMGEPTLGKYMKLTGDYANAQTEEEEKEAARKLGLMLQREVERTASKKLKAGTVVFMALTVAIVAGAFVAFALEEQVIGFACIGGLLGLTLIFAVIIACSSHVRTKPSKSADKTGKGKVVACAMCIGVSVLAGFTKTGGRVAPKYKSKSNYKVVINLDGRCLYAYSHSLYCYGNSVNVAYSDKSDKCYII